MTGGQLSALERKANLTHEDRIKIIGHCDLNTDFDSSNRKIRDHLKSIISNNPTMPGLIHCNFLQLILHRSYEKELADLWQEQIEKHGDDNFVLTNAAAFFKKHNHGDEQRAIRLCKRVLSRDPKNERALFVLIRSINSMLFSANEVEEKKVTAQNLYRYLTRFWEVIENPHHKQSAAADLALVAVEAGYYPEVFHFSRIVIESGTILSDSFDNLSNIHKAHTAAGLAYLHSGDRANAINELFCSAHSEGLRGPMAQSDPLPFLLHEFAKRQDFEPILEFKEKTIKNWKESYVLESFVEAAREKQQPCIDENSLLIASKLTEYYEYEVRL